MSDSLVGPPSRENPKGKNLGGVIAQAGGPPILIIQAEGTAIPLSVTRAPASAEAVLAEVNRVRGKS